MSKSEYDFGAPGSIMQQIQALIKPPGDDNSKQTSKPSIKHQYYRRPGRGHNHDTCDACQEGGNLLCCDRCPCSFHLECHDPPLSQEDIPDGQWLCHNCRMTSKPSTSKASSLERVAGVRTNESDQSRPNTPFGELDGSSVPHKKVRGLRKRSSSRRSASSETSATEKPTAVTLPKFFSDPNRKPTLMDDLIKAASLMNPKQFELPKELELHFPFPGSDKVERTAKNGNKKVARNTVRAKRYEFNFQGFVPLPAKTCFYCRKSCRKAPLVACDYCSLFFHQDCLEPPLTALPTGLWMCPNHLENYVDSNLVSSISATERVKLWNKFGGPIDGQTVKIEFLRRVHTKHPPFRYKAPPLPRKITEIPHMISHHYKNPPPLLPSLRTALRSKVAMKQDGVEKHLSENEVAESLINEDLNALKQASKKVRELSKEMSSEPIVSDSSDEEESANAQKEFTKEEKKKPAVDRRRAKRKIEEVEDTSFSENKKLDAGEEKPESDDDELDGINIETPEETIDKVIDSELIHLDVDTIKLLAFQRLQTIIADHPDIVDKYRNRNAAKTIREICKSDPNMNLPLPSQLLTKEDIDKIARTFSLPEPKVDVDNTELEANSVSIPRSDMEKVREIAVRMEPQIISSKIRARAVFTPVGNLLEGKRWFANVPLEKSVYMRYRTFNIGCGQENDLDLSSFGYCGQTSAKHASVFFDEITQIFELLNYSQFGTYVDGQLYSCDVTLSTGTPAKENAADPKNLKTTIRELIDRKRGFVRLPLSLNEKESMAAAETELCSCDRQPPIIAGWEGSALIKHGTYLQFGCIPFVFAVAEFDQPN